MTTRPALSIEALTTPCTGVCSLDRTTGWCHGCGRTGEEIASWVRMGPEGRQRVWALLPERLESMNSDRPDLPDWRKPAETP